MVRKLGWLLALILWGGMVLCAPAPCPAQDLQRALQSQPSESSPIPSTPLLPLAPTDGPPTTSPDRGYEMGASEEDSVLPAPPKSMFEWHPNEVVEQIQEYDYPLLERPGLESRWFAQVDTTLAMSHIDSHVTSGNLLSGTFPNPVQLPVAQLNMTAMPRFQIGYRRPQGLGEFLISYRFLFAQGTEQLASVDALGGGAVTSRLGVHVLDLDYAFTEYVEGNPPILPPIIRWNMGVRVAGAFFDSTATGQQVLSQRSSNTFVGAGPNVALDLTWPLATTKFSVFTRTGAAAVIGQNRQRFDESVAQTGGGVVAASAATNGAVVAVPVANVQAGVNWVPDWKDGRLRLSAGYQWERWWNMGNDTTSYAELTIQGPFLRGEWAF